MMNRFRTMLCCLILMLCLPACRAAMTNTTDSQTEAISLSPESEEKISVPSSTDQAEPNSDTYLSDAKTDHESALIHAEPQCKPSFGFSFSLPENWSYELVQTEDEPTDTVSALLYPGQDARNGGIVIEYTRGFGVCGTGLEEKDINFNGHEAGQGFYDGNPVWSFIALKDDYRGCVILNQMENNWMKYEADIAQILSTVVFQFYE